MGKEKDIYNIYIITAMSKITKPFDFFKKLDFASYLPDDFAPWNMSNYVMAHLNVSGANDFEANVTSRDLLKRNIY